MKISREALIAGAFSQDPRTQKAKQLLLEALADHQKSINGIRPPQASLKQAYDIIVSTFGDHRGNPLYYPFVGSGIGKGALVELLDGSIKYDFISGIGVHYWGHSHPEIISKAIDAAISDTVMQGHLQQNWDSYELSKLLVQVSELDHCFLASSGAMANENALKIIFQKKFPAHRILAFDRCFIGRTMALSQISDKPSYREGLPSTLFVDYVPFYDFRYPEESTKAAIAILKKHLKRYPKQHALMCFELVQGEGGFYPGTKEFFCALMSILKDHQIAIFADEIQTFGRTSQLFAYQHFGLKDYVDVASLGKLSQVCATVFTNEYQPRAGLLSQTFTSSTTAIQTAEIIISHLINDHFFGPSGKITQIEQYTHAKLHDLEKRYPHLITGPYGIGAMVAFTPWGGDAPKVAQFAKQLFEAGVISFVAGTNPTRIRFLLPAGIVSFADIDVVMDIVEKTLLNNSP